MELPYEAHRYYVERVLEGRPSYLHFLIHRIQEALMNPVRKVKDRKGRTRRWVLCEERNNRYLRVIVGEDG